MANKGAARVTELPVTFPCGRETLVGMVHKPLEPSQTGVVIVVGGPQYRVGSHRQFLLLARFLAANGIAVMRFDYRGMGDSSGALKTFEDVSEDIRAAIDTLYLHQPELESVALWGLCDAASAALFYACTDSRVSKMILLNPWVRTESGEAQTLIKNYYRRRLLDAAFWKKIFTGRFRVGDSLRALVDNAKNAFGSKESGTTASLPERMLVGLQRFDGKICIILSGNDLTADEFRNLIKASCDWKSALSGKADIRELPEANHTFSSHAWGSQVEQWTLSALENGRLDNSGE